MALTVVRGGLGDVFPGSAATHAGSRLGKGGLELFGAGAVDLGDRIANTKWKADSASNSAPHYPPGCTAGIIAI
jgi:hypothetical protein